MWTPQNVIALVVAIGGAAVSLGIFMQKVNQLHNEVVKLNAALKEMRESRYRQGKRLGRLEGWIAAADGIAEGKPPPLASHRHDTRGIPIGRPVEHDSGTVDDDEKEGGPGG